MSRKNITNELVCKAVDQFQRNRERFPHEILAEWTGEPEKVCYRALERAEEIGLIEYGVSLRTGWLTDKGQELLRDAK